MFQSTDQAALAKGAGSTGQPRISPGGDPAARPQAADVLAGLFAFRGTLAPNGTVLFLAGRIFDGMPSDPQKLVGQNITETVFWQTSDANYRLIADAVEAAGKGIASETVLKFRRSKDDILTIELNLLPVYDPDRRQVEHIFLCGRDVTARESEIEFHRRRAEYLLYAAESAGVGLWHWDLGEGPIFATPKCNEFFGLQPFETMSYPSLLESIHPDDRQNLVDVVTESQRTGGEYEVEFRVLDAAGEVKWLAMRGRTYLDAEASPASTMGVVRRLADGAHSDGDLTRAHALERKARDEAEEANRTKDYFLALVSHELRSPLNAVLGWTKILLTREVDEKTRLNALRTIERSAMSQAKLISDLVDSSRIASGKLRLEMRPMSLFDAIGTVVNSQRPVAETRRIGLEFEFDSREATIFGDLVRIQQVFTNLLTNALKFTPEGGRITVTLTTDKDQATVLVEDNGQGISAETLPHIFRQFSQGMDAADREQSGLGLGLSIVKTLVEKHEGSVRAYSAGEGCGALFVVCLPLVPNRKVFIEADRSESRYEDSELRGVRILCVEDDLDSREVLHLFLEQNGATVLSVESAAAAMLAIENENDGFDAVISDLAMPVEDGYSLIARLRALPDPRAGSIPAIALSAFTSPENRQRALAFGFQKYHTKPFEPDVLVDDILDLVKKTS